MLLTSVLHDPAAHAGIAGEQQAHGSGRLDRRLLSRHEGELAVLRIGERELQVVADAKVQRDARMDPEIVLRERADVRAVVGLSHRRVLRHRRREAEQEVGVGVAGLAAVEGEDAVVVEQRVVDDRLVRDVAADLERVLALGDAQRILHADIVAAGVRSGDRRLAGEVAGDREPRQRRVALRRELRVQVRRATSRDCSRARRTGARRCRAAD